MSSLLINELSFGYQMNTVYDSVSFEAYMGDLTVVKGESGSGKSTFLDILSLKHGLNFNLVLNDKKIKSKDEIINDIYYLKQNPILCNDLTIKEQWILLKEIYNSKIDLDMYIKKLKLEQVQNSYPLQLSAGEKYRCIFINALIINPYILLIDEPTAALNEEYKEILVDMLNELKRNTILVVSTHDSFLIEKADVVFEIHDYKLNKIKDISNKCKGDKKNVSMSYLNWVKQFIKMKKHHLIKNILSLLIISISITFCCFSFHLDAGLLSSLEQQMEQEQNNTILVFKALDQRNPTYKSNHSSSTYFSITKNEYNEIKEMDYISDMYPEIILYSNSDFDTDYIPTFEIYNHNNECIYTYDTTVQQEIANQIYTYTLYYENIDEKELNEYLIKNYKFADNGIYVNSLLLERCGLKNTNLENCYVKANIEVPVYEVSGKLSTLIGDASNNEEEWIPANSWSTKTVTLTFPISGIVSTGFESDMRAYPYNALYLSRETLISIINEYRLSNSYDEYFKEVNQEFVLTTDKKEADVIHKYTPWEVNAYNVVVDNSEHVDKVVSNLKSMGYSVEWKYNTLKNYKDSIEHTKEMIQKIGISFVLIVVAAFGIGFFVKEKQEIEFNEWLVSIGYKKKKDIYVIKVKKYLTDFLFVLVFSIIIQCVFNYCMLFTLRTKYYIDILSVVITIVVSFLLTLLIPVAWEGLNNDQS